MTDYIGKIPVPEIVVSEVFLIRLLKLNHEPHAAEVAAAVLLTTGNQKAAGAEQERKRKRTPLPARNDILNHALPFDT